MIALPTYRIAVIRKHASSRRIAFLMLTAQGFDVSVFESPETFLASQSDPPDCIVCGTIFEGFMSASGLIEELAERGWKIPVIIHSFMHEYEESMMQAGAAAFIEDRGNYDRVAAAISEAIAAPTPQTCSWRNN